MKALDLFAGAGGFTAGASRAGLDVVWAANHWPLAVDAHRLNHPGTEHSCQDLRQADFSRAPDVDVILAGPACQGHSNAGRGARGKWGLDFGHHDSARATAWAVVDAVEAKEPRYLVVENVRQFRQWKLYPTWAGSLGLLGYQLAEVYIDAADAGAPQNRKRLFVIGWRDGDRPALSLPRQPWVPASSILDVEGPGDWAPVKSKSAAVQRRVARGRARYGDVFLSCHVTDHPGRSLERPLPTITGADQQCLVRGDEIRKLTLAEYLSGQGFPADYDLGGAGRKAACQLIGNAVAVPVAEHICRCLTGQGD